MTFRGQVAFADAADLEAALRVLDGAEDCALDARDFERANLLLELSWDSTAPSAFYDGTLDVLRTIGDHARAGWFEASYGGTQRESFAVRKRGRTAGTRTSGASSRSPRVDRCLVAYAFDEERGEPEPGTPSWVFDSVPELEVYFRPDIAPYLTTVPEIDFLARLNRAIAGGVRELGSALEWALATGAPWYAFQLEPGAAEDAGEDESEPIAIELPRKIDPATWRCLVCGGTDIERRREKIVSMTEARCLTCGAYDDFRDDDLEPSSVSEQTAETVVGALDDWVGISGGVYLLGLLPDEARRLAEQCVTATLKYLDEEGDLSTLTRTDPEREIDELTAKLTRLLPPREVKLEPFSITRVPVLNADWLRFVEATGARAPDPWRFDDAREPGRPVVCVSWEEANAFARFAMAELPSEAQWQCAARGRERRLFPWGNDFAVGEFMLRADRQVPWPARAHPELATDSGCLDMVTWWWEWCRDEQTFEPEVAKLFGPRDPSGRVLCGGEGFDPMVPTALSRTAMDPAWCSSVKSTGFRLVRSR